VQIVDIDGLITNWVAGHDTAFTIVGPTARVTIGAGQHLTTVLAAQLGHIAAQGSDPYVGVSFYYGICLRSADGQTFMSFVDTLDGTGALSGNTSRTFVATRSIFNPATYPLIPPGSYDVGFCVTSASDNLDDNGQVVGWVTVN
jgi:hypothetical protein